MQLWTEDAYSPNSSGWEPPFLRVVSPVCLCFLCLWFVPRLIFLYLVRQHGTYVGTLSPTCMYQY